MLPLYGTKVYSHYVKTATDMKIKLRSSAGNRAVSNLAYVPKLAIDVTAILGLL